MPINHLNPKRFSPAALSQTPHPHPSTPETTPKPTILYSTEINHHPVEWLWPDRLALGTLSILSGEPGSGKTWIALAIAAALSKENPTEPITTLYATNQQLRPALTHARSQSLGGDPTRLALLRETSSI